MITSTNPATGDVLRRFEPLSPADVERCLASAAAAFPMWRAVTLGDRLECLRRAAEILEREREALGGLMTEEMGKPIRAAMDEAAKCARACRYYVEHAARMLQDLVVPTDAVRSFVRFQPLGPVLAIMPWNFPFWQVFRFAAPALAAGNVGLLKHASNVPQCALAIEDIWRRAGVPGGAFQTLLIGSDVVARLIADPRVAAVTLTGSEHAGSEVAAAAGRAIKKTVLELGGSDPFIVMPSADLDAAVSTAVTARTINNGQSCIAAKRFIVHESIALEFTRRFVDGMAALRVGDPMDPATQVGPLATPAIRDDLERQVRESVAMGARVLVGGERVDGPGNFYPPTVLDDVPRDAPAAREEMFGPVAALFTVRSVDEAIALANDTTFGLGAAAWTTAAEDCERFVDELQAGLVFINGMVASDPRLPFGGVKRSGYGRELGEVGIHEFVNIKTVWIGAPSQGGLDATE